MVRERYSSEFTLACLFFPDKRRSMTTDPRFSPLSWFANDGAHFWVGEMVCLTGGNVGIISCFYSSFNATSCQIEGPYADVELLEEITPGVFYVCRDLLHNVSLSTMTCARVSSEATFWNGQKDVTADTKAKFPEPAMPVYTIALRMSSDETSGNLSKVSTAGT